MMIKSLNNNENISYLIGKEDINIILTRAILSLLSSLCCLLLIIIYIINFLQIKFSLCLKKENNDSNDLLEDEISSQNNDKKANNNKKEGKIGLGSNFMLF